MQTPIVIIAFDRDEYLEQFCASLRVQKNVSLSDNRIHLMQDGAKSNRTGYYYTTEEKLNRCEQVFRRYFPGGHVHRSPENLGIALNFERAESFAFRKLGAETAFFFEDDMVLGPYYLSILERIRIQIAHHPSAGYFACYGDFQRPSNPDHPQFVPLEHHWGFGLTRRCWEEMQPWLKPFYDVYRKSDYKWRPHLSVLKCFLEKDVGWDETSQDVAKTAACASLGFARVNTDVCYARYVGAKGQSFNDETFRLLGFDRAPLVESEALTLEPIGEGRLRQFAEEKRMPMKAFRDQELERHIAMLSARMFEPDRLASREDVDAAWKTIMDRLPGEDFYERNVGKISVRQIRTELLRSAEARGKSSYS